MTPAVSIVMAAKNYARFLPEAVESVRNQSFNNWELLIIDDGSTDQTATIVRPFLADSRIRYFRSDMLGQPRAKNLGVRFSRAPLIAFLDADDAWEPTKLEKQLPIFDAKPQVGVVFCERTLMDESGKRVVSRAERIAYSGRVLPHIFTQNFVCFSSCVLRREVLTRVGAFDPEWDLSIDYDLWLRVANHYEFGFVNEALVRYRTGHGNLSKKLRDRVDTALAIMHRGETRYGVREAVPRAVIADGYASTCQTLAYTLRPSEPFAALNWYLRALAWPARRLISLKGIAASAVAALCIKRTAGAPENSSENG